MPKIRRGYKGAAVAAALGSGGVTSATQTSIGLSSSPTTFPSGKFFIVVAPGTAQEEKMCVTLSGSTLTVVDPNVSSTSASVNGRGVDNTTARSTIAGGATVYPVATAIDFDEANELTSKYAAQGSVVYQGASTFTELAIGTAGYALKVNSGATAPEWGQLPAAGIASNAITADKIDSTVAGNGLNGGGGSALSVNVDASTIEINSDALRVKDLGITTAKLALNAVDGTILADDSVTSAKIVNGTIVNADISSSAAITLSKLASAAAGQIVVHNASGVPTAITMSGDATISSSGALTIANNAVTAAKLASGSYPVYINPNTSGLPTTDGTIAYINSGDSAEGIQTYNGSSWGKSWNMPWGVVAYAQATSSQNFTTVADVPSVTTGSVTYVANRLLRITIQSSKLTSSVSGDRADVFLTDGAATPVQIQTAAVTIPTGAIGQSVTLVAYVSTGAGGDVTYKARMSRGDGSGTISTNASATNPFQIIVEDIGPSGNPA